MKTFILLLTTLFFLFSCTDEIESEYFNPNHLIKVNFESKKGYEGRTQLNLASKEETEVCLKIIRSQLLPANISYKNICSGGNNKNLSFSYIEISGKINAIFLIVYDEKRMIAYRLNHFSDNCLLKWVIEFH